MFRVDVGRILNEHLISYDGPRTRYLDPFGDYGFEPDDFESDEFRMYSFKVKKCPLNRIHDWTVCPYAHRGERARRRDPLRHSYVALACPEFRATGGHCPRGELCPYAHGVFEYWLHPAKYRTRVCTAGEYCTRPVCFFAHTPYELRSEPAHHIPKWARVALQAEAEARAQGSPSFRSGNNSGSGSGSGSGGQGSGVIARPNPALLDRSCGASSNVMANGYTNLNLELWERLKKLDLNGIGYYDNQVGKNDYIKNNNNVDLDTPNISWVADLLAGEEFK